MNDNNPVHLLIAEHDVISSAENFINENEKLWIDDPIQYSNNVKKLLIFFREYGDKFHHHKEEEILFKELKAKPEFFLVDLIDELESHHQQFRELLAEIENKLEVQEWEKSYSLLNEYFQNLLDHISVENMELFNMVDSVFSDDELLRIYFLFEDIDRELGYENKIQASRLLSHVK